MRDSAEEIGKGRFIAAKLGDRIRGHEPRLASQQPQTSQKSTKAKKRPWANTEAIDIHARTIQNRCVNDDATASSSRPRLFSFDASDKELSLLPLCARRALDLSGLKFGLAPYQELNVATRYRLAHLGSQDEVDSAAVREIAHLTRQVEAITPVDDPDPHRVPEELKRVLGPDRPLSDKVWIGLTPLERYALVKVAQKNKPTRVEACYQEIIGAQQVSTHLRPQGGVRMVSISQKAETARQAQAESWVTMSSEAYNRLVRSDIPKGDVLGTARLAGIMATKKTADLIPLCHPLALQHAEVDFEHHPQEARLRVLCSVEVYGRTGVEMEAMVGASTAALTIYDMLKSLDRALSIGPTRLIAKSGGRSGNFSHPSTPPTPS